MITDVCPANCDFKTLDRIPFKVKKGGSSDHGELQSFEECEWTLETTAGPSSMLLIPKFYAVARSPSQFVHL